MISTNNLSLNDFDYPLPEHKIAQFPLEQRDASKLLIWKDGSMSEDIFSNIGDHLPGDSVLVFNDTKVIRARLFFIKPTGAFIEIFCLEPIAPEKELQAAFSMKGHSTWECLIGNVKRWRSGSIEKKIEIEGSVYTLSAEKKENLGNGCFSVEFSWQPESLAFSEILEKAGLVPLPPYINRPSEEKDISTYQTVYAKYDGSVAAPTAGLHFTQNLLEKLGEKPVCYNHITLHVGLGTFRPVSSSDISKHIMHEEKIYVPISTIEQMIRSPEKPIIAVGTTTVRTLESLYWLGVKLIVDGESGFPAIYQWDPYNPAYNIGIPLKTALNKVLNRLKSYNLDHFSGVTQVMIIPGYEFKVIKGIITNFHLPKSTLLMLIAAFAGISWKNMYDYALRHDFRFLSYGDACFLWKGK
jgi:S-adenosylmethionine:tRNA ribosyltransferase-isomerase